jgi:soluble lytic murein transglycosylase-like protein
MGQYADMLAALPPEQRRKLPYNHPLVNGYTSEVEQAAGVPPGWLHAIKNYGERSNSDQTSPTGAKGVMQFMPKNADAYGVRDPSDPLDAIPGAARYVNKMRRQFGDRPDLVFAGYNGGEGNLERVGRNIARMPPETQAYVQRTYGALTGGQPAPAAPAAPARDADTAAVSFG